MISTLSGSTRYGMTYGVPVSTNSLVPRIRPGRPDAGYMRSRSTAFTSVAAIFRAAFGLDRSMYCRSASRCRSERLDQTVLISVDDVAEICAIREPWPIFSSPKI